MRTVLAVAAAVLACVQPGEAFGVGSLMARAGFRSAPVMARLPLSLRRSRLGSEVVPMQEPVRRCVSWQQSGLTTRLAQSVDMIALVVRRVCCRRRAIQRILTLFTCLIDWPLFNRSARVRMCTQHTLC